VQCKDSRLTCTDFQVNGESFEVLLNGQQWCVAVVQIDAVVYVFHRNLLYELHLSDRLANVRAASGQLGTLQAPLPGRVARVLVDIGDAVKAGQVLVVIEAMKMEHPIMSPIGGTVAALPFAENQLVDEGDHCVVVEPMGSESH